MPNRYVRESAIESERVNALSWLGEVFFRRLINKVDDFGRFSANKAILRAALFPLKLDEITEEVVGACLVELEESGLAIIYSVEGKLVLQLAKWEKGRAKESKYPPPPASISQRPQTLVYNGKQVQTNVPDSDTDYDYDPDSDTPLRGGEGEIEGMDLEKLADDEVDAAVDFTADWGDHPEGVTDKDRCEAVCRYAIAIAPTLPEPAEMWMVEEFVDHFDKYHWRAGPNDRKIRDWKAAFRIFIRDKPRTQTKAKKPA